MVVMNSSFGSLDEKSIPIGLPHYKEDNKSKKLPYQKSLFLSYASI